MKGAALGRLPPRNETPTQRGRLLLKVLVGFAAGMGIVASVLVAMRVGRPAGSVLVIGLAMLPMPLLWLAFWWLGRYEPQPLRYQAGAFVWGGVGAVGLAALVQVPVMGSLDLSSAQGATFIAPLSEEPAKGLFLALTFLRWRRVIASMVDGLFVAGLVGLGFAFVENILYYAASYRGLSEAPISGASGAASTFVVRGILSPFAHPIFNTGFAIGLVIAVTLHSRIATLLVVSAGMVVSMFLHGLWNGSAAYGGVIGFALVYLGFGVVFVLLIALAVVARIRRGQTLRRSLYYVAQRGWITPDQIPYMSRFGYRTMARRYARKHYGKFSEQVVVRYQRLATEMAFLHDAIMLGRTKPHGVERVYGLLRELRELRPALHLPPALPALPPR